MSKLMAILSRPWYDKVVCLSIWPFLWMHTSVVKYQPTCPWVAVGVPISGSVAKLLTIGMAMQEMESRTTEGLDKSH